VQSADWVALQLAPPLRKRCYYELRRSAGWRRMSGSSTRAHEYDLKDRAAEKLTSKVMPYLTVSGADVIAVRKEKGRSGIPPKHMGDVDQRFPSSMPVICYAAMPQEMPRFELDCLVERAEFELRSGLPATPRPKEDLCAAATESRRLNRAR
jgi:hypothetical protein